MLQILDADIRMKEKRGPKIAIVGISNAGKTSQLKTLDQATLDKTLFIDAEAGDLPVRAVRVASVRPGKWQEFVDLACIVGGPNPALPPNAAYSQDHYDSLMKNSELAALTRYEVLFIDSITEIARRCLIWAEVQPESYTDRGRKNLMGTYGLLGRSMIALLQQFQHARQKTIIFVTLLELVTDDLGVKSWELQISGQQTRLQFPGIIDVIVTLTQVDFGDGKPPTRCFVCQPNQWGYLTKDRSGCLDLIEEPHLGKLLTKIASTRGSAT